ncbi:MAG: hypothetical protein ABEJ76_09035 [Halanaeroarchaeum sp.]
MTDNLTRIGRRKLITAGATAAIIGTSGCTAEIDALGSGSSTTKPSVDASIPTKERFRFDYLASSNRVKITYLGGTRVVAGTLWIQSASDGTKVNWPQLGSTSSAADEPLTRGDTAVIGKGVLHWPTNVDRSDTIRLVYREGDAPTTIARFSPPERTTTVTTTVPPKEPTGFSDGFEDGDLEDWSAVELTEGALDRNGNNWSVVSKAITGDYSLHLRSLGDHSDNGLATDEYVVDMTEDFTLSFDWITPDPNNRGPGIRLLNQDGTNFEETSREEILARDAISMDYGADAISRAGSPFKGKANFGGVRFERMSYEPNTVHSVRIEKAGSEADLYFDGQHQQTAPVDSRGTYRLVLVNSGTWGDESTIRFDNVAVRYGDTQDARSPNVDGFESNSGDIPTAWNVKEETGEIRVVTDAYEGAYALRMPTGGNKIWQPLSGPIRDGTVFGAWAKTDRVGPRNHRVYQVGDGGGFGTGTYVSMRFRKGEVHINGDAITAETLFSEPGENTWYRFEMEVLGDGEVEFRLRNATGQVLARRTKTASNSSDYSRVELWTGDVSPEGALVWFDNVRVNV